MLSENLEVKKSQSHRRAFPNTRVFEELPRRSRVNLCVACHE